MGDGKKAYVIIDTLHLMVKYPAQDVFDRWYQFADGVHPRKLREGIVAGDYVVKSGGSGYKCSVWQHDARAYLTDWVEEKVGEKAGMGIWVQLGPKFIIQHIGNLHLAVNDFLSGIGIRGIYPIRINRIDLAFDLFDVDINEENILSWKEGWVGRSKVSRNEFNTKNGALETINVGRRTSAVFLRVYNKVAQASKEGDIDYWRDVWQGFQGMVTRVEWEVKPGEGNFKENLRDFTQFDPIAIRELLVYLLDWGRLCIPNPTDKNNRRWEDADFWKNLRELAQKWLASVTWPTSRYGKEFHGISEQYVRFLSGTIAGGMARFGEDNPSMYALLEGLGKFGESVEVINKKAAAKAAIRSKL